jgi:hypothetical protein
MNARTKLLIVVFLTGWTTSVAWLTTLMIHPLYPEFYGSPGLGLPTQALIALPKFTPFIALPIAFAQAMKVLRKKSAIDTAMLARYFLGAPAWIFLALLILISVMTLIFAPLTFVYGLFYGSVPALAGTAVHCLGMVPLYLLNRAGLVRSRG